MGASCPAPEAGPEPDKVMQANFASAVLTDEFKECMKKQRPLHIPKAVTDLNHSVDINDILKALAKGSVNGSCGAYKNGEPCMRGNFFLAYLDHATLTLTDADHFLPQLLDLCRSLSPTFQYVTSRIVIDPPGVRIPTLTADSDMIAIQIWGEQRLKLCHSIMGLPVTAKRPEPLIMPTMCPGDALYVPQGLEVRFEDAPPLQRGEVRGPTMYAVLSVRTSEQMLGVSLGKHLQDLLRETGLSENTDRFLRTAVTRRTLPKAGADSPEAQEKKAKLEADLKAAIEEITQKMSAATLREHVSKRMDQLVKEQSESAAKMARQGVFEEDQQVQHDTELQVLSTSYVRISQGVTCECHPGSQQALFTRGSETLPLPIAESASYLISELCNGKPRLVSSLTCRDPLERLCVCQILIRKDCMEVWRPPKDASGPSSR
jgi:hypothetical protein